MYRAQPVSTASNRTAATAVRAVYQARNLQAGRTAQTTRQHGQDAMGPFRRRLSHGERGQSRGAESHTCKPAPRNASISGSLHADLTSTSTAATAIPRDTL